MSLSLCTLLLMGLLISRSIFKNLLQNLEGKLIKISSKSKALNSLACTPDLFISSYPKLYRCGRSLQEPLMVLTELCASSHPLWPLAWNSWCSRDAGISNDDSQCRVGAQAVIRYAQVGTTWPPWQWRSGCCTTPTNTLWPANDSLRNSHTVRVKCAGALSCWNDTCYIIPLLLGSGIT